MVVVSRDRYPQYIFGTFNRFHYVSLGRMSRKGRAFSETNCPLGVLTANYGNQLSVALNDPPVTWASDAGWVTAVPFRVFKTWR
jgi:hypothetical protein